MRWLADRRRLAIWIAIAAAALFARCQWDRLTDAQTPRETFDSQIYREIAAQPLGVDTFFYPKPPTVPLVYRITGDDPGVIAGVQAELAFAAWAVLAVVLALAMRRWWTRAAAIGVAIAFVLAAPRVGFSGAILSESIDDSLKTLAVAGALGLALGRPSDRRAVMRERAIAIAFGVVAILWLYARDSNAITMLAAIASAAILWTPRRWPRWGIALAAVSAAAALLMLLTPSVVPDRLPYQATWYPRLASRQMYPVINNVLARVMADDREWLADRGAPVELLDKFAGDVSTDKLVQDVPELRPAQDWIAEHGQGTYVRWLLRHPIDRTFQLVGAWTTVLAAHNTTTMPVGWRAHDNIALDLLRGLTTNRWIVLALVAVSPILLWRPRRDPRTAIALVMVASGTIGTAAAYYGDAAEIARHCYGAGQQIVLGLFIAALARLDRMRDDAHDVAQISVEAERTPPSAIA
jgi:hypothetical protein